MRKNIRPTRAMEKKLLKALKEVTTQYAGILVIEHVCKTVSIIHNSTKDFLHASDCFCGDDFASFQHEGTTLRFLRQAVLEKLERDGFFVERGLIDEHLAEYDKALKDKQV